MKIYSIVRMGDAYVVRAGETSVLKIATRRQAARLVTDAEELLETQLAPPLSGQEHAEPSIVGDLGVILDPPSIIPDPSGVIPDPHGVIPDPSGGIPDPSEVS
jgi:hypothetical protein